MLCSLKWVEKIRAENRQMLQQEKEQFLKAQEEKEQNSSEIPEGEVLLTGNESTGKGKGKVMPSGKGTPFISPSQSKGKGKRMPSNDDSESDGTDHDSDSDENSNKNKSDKNKEKSKHPQRESINTDAACIFRDIKMKSLTVNVEKLDVKDLPLISPQDKSENKVEVNSTPTNEPVSSTKKMSPGDEKKGPNQKKATPPKAPKEFEPALFSTPDIMMKKGTDPHNPHEQKRRPSSALADEQLVSSNENTILAHTNVSESVIPPRTLSDATKDCESSANEHDKSRVCVEKQAEKTVSSNDLTGNSKNSDFYANNKHEETSRKSLDTHNATTISKNSPLNSKDAFTSKTPGNSSKSPQDVKDKTSPIPSNDNTPTSSKKIVAKSKPSLIRTNVIDTPTTDNLPQAKRFMNSPAISKSLMNYKIPFKNPRPPTVTPTKTALANTTLQQSTNSSSSPGNPVHTNNPGNKGNPHNPASDSDRAKNPQKVAKNPHKVDISSRKNELATSKFINVKKHKTPELQEPKSPKKQTLDVSSPKTPSLKSPPVIDLIESPSDIRRSTRPAKKKSFGEDFVEKATTAHVEKAESSDFEVPSPVNSSEDSSSENEEYDDPERLWCICQKPHSNRFMICCDRCEDWFHGSCVGVTKAMGKQMEAEEREWICPKCKKVEKAIKGNFSPLKKDSQAEKEVEIQIIKQNPSIRDSYDKANVLVYDKRTMKILAASEAPTLRILPEWLKKYPNYATISMEMTRFIKTDPKTGIKTLDIPPEAVSDDDSKESPEIASKHFYGSSPKKKHKSHKHSKRLKEEMVSKKHRDLNVTPVSSKKVGHTPQSTMKEKKRLQLDLADSAHKTPIRRDSSQRRESLSSPGTPKDRRFSTDKKDDTPYHRKEKKSKSLKSEGEFLPQKPNFPDIRSSVRKILFESLEKRKSEVPLEFPNLTSEVIQNTCEEIEEKLYLAFNKDVGFKYKSRYRSLIFNIKDPKNSGLFRQILNKTIPPSKLVVMTSEELASQELAKWREQEEKKELEAIQKHELDMLALGNQYIMKSHKGEIMIDKDDFIKSKETVPDSVNLPTEEEEVKAENSQQHEEEIINSHKNHIYDPNCKICMEAAIKSYNLSLKDEEANGNKENLSVSPKREDGGSDSSRHKYKKRKKDRDRSRDKRHKHSKAKHRERHSSDENEGHRSKHKSRRQHDKSKRHRSRDRKESEKRYSRKDSESSDNVHRRSHKDKRHKRRQSSESSQHKRSRSESSSKRDDSSFEKDVKSKKKSSTDNVHNNSGITKDANKAKQNSGSNSDSKPEVSTSEDVVVLPSDSVKSSKYSAADTEPTSTGSPSGPPKEEEYSSLSSNEEADKCPSSPIEMGSPSTPPLPEPSSDFEYDKEEVAALTKTTHDEKGSTTPPQTVEIEEELLSPATPPLPDEDRLTPPPPTSQTPLSVQKGPLAPIWKGSINMPDVARFHSAAFEVSGKSRYFTGDVPLTVEVVGRISPDAVWPYIAQMKKSGTKEILVARFQPSSEVERASYIALYFYLSSKKRYGVIGSCGRSVKDFYLVPLAAHQPIPQVLLPLDGPGFEESRPHMLIGVIVRVKHRKSYDPVSGVWLEDETANAKQKRTSIDDDSSGPLNSPNDDSLDRSYTPPPTSLVTDDSKPESLPSKPTYPPTSIDFDQSSETELPLPITKHISQSQREKDSMLDELNRQIEIDRKELSEMQKTVDETIDDNESHTPPGTPPPLNDEASDGSALDTTKITIPSNLHEILNNIKKKEEAIMEKEMELKRRLNISIEELDEIPEAKYFKPDSVSSSKDVDFRLFVPQSQEPIGGIGKDEDMRLLSHRQDAPLAIRPPLRAPIDTDFRMRDPSRLPLEEDIDGALSQMSDADLIAKALEMENNGPPPHNQNFNIPPHIQDARSFHPANLSYNDPNKPFPPPVKGFHGPMPPFEQFEPPAPHFPDRGLHHNDSFLGSSGSGGRPPFQSCDFPNPNFNPPHSPSPHGSKGDPPFYKKFHPRDPQFNFPPHGPVDEWPPSNMPPQGGPPHFKWRNNENMPRTRDQDQQHRFHDDDLPPQNYPPGGPDQFRGGGHKWGKRRPHSMPYNDGYHRGDRGPPQHNMRGGWRGKPFQKHKKWHKKHNESANRSDL